MRKSLIVFLLSFFAIFTLSVGMEKVNAEDAEVTLKGKVVIHYQKWDNDYDNVGIHAWDNGTGANVGTPHPATVDTDDFGVIMEAKVMSDATTATMGIIVFSDVRGTSWTEWDNQKDSGDLRVDITKIKDGTVSEIHIYYFQGGTLQFFVGDPTKANVFVIYYDPSAAYESNLGLHSWGFDATSNAEGWGKPLKAFKDAMKSPGGIQGKVALLNYTPGSASDTGALVYAGDDATKKHAGFGDLKELTITGFNALKAGESLVVYVSGGEVYLGEEGMLDFAEMAFAFGFQTFQIGNLGGTYAKNPTTIFAKTTIGVVTQEKTGTDKVTVSVRKEKKEFTADPDGWKLPTDLPEFTAYTPTALPAGMSGRVVVHFQKWDGDYSSVGTWSWGTGAGGTADGTPMTGVDDFGAVIELNVAADAADFGFKTILKNIDNDDRWKSESSKTDVKPDISKIIDGTVEEIHVYMFEGSSEFFVADPENANVLVVYHNQSGTYDEKLNIHNWGLTTAENGWDNLGILFKNGMMSPGGIQGKVAMAQYAPGTTANPGLIIRNGSGEGAVKLHPTNIDNTNPVGLANVVAGGVFVVYMVNEEVFSERTEFAPKAFGGTVKTVYYYVDEEQEVDVMGPLDITPFFVLKQGETIIPIESISYNKTATSTNQFVIQLAAANKLDPSKSYKLYFNNNIDAEKPLEEAARLEAEVDIDMDKNAPEITFVGQEGDGVYTKEITLGSKWDNDWYPSIRVSDNRDKTTLEELVYVVKDKGRLDTTKVGTYPITVSVEDVWGNVTEATFNFVVVAPEVKGCGGETASIFVGMGLLGLAFVFKRRRAA